MINIKSNGQGFISSATLECIGAMLEHRRGIDTKRTPTPVIAPTSMPATMPPVTVKGAEPPFEETLIQYWQATRRRKPRLCI